jgi:endonuclease/exonuclease/phosphatase (EEP) superfamily protein YafD
MEYSEAIQGQIETAFAEYPYRLIQPSRMTMGLALFSRVPIQGSEIYRFQATRIPIYQVQMSLDGKPFTFIGGHPWPPQPQWGELHRNQMQEITRIAAQSQPPLIVAGDFNAVPWAYTVRQLAELTDTYHIQPGPDTARTWFPFPFFGLALDHVLVSGEWRVLNYRHGAQGGSDHLPIVVDVQLR